MPSYAPTNVHHVTVNAPQGCGQTHRRPLGDDGEPVSRWTEPCPVCRKHLTSTLGWGGTEAEVPETYDEKLQREYREQQGARDVEQATAASLKEMASMPAALAALPEGIGQAIAQGITAALAMQQAGDGETVRCAEGHANPVSVKFCGECGSPMGELVSAVVPDAPHAAVSAPEPPAPAPAKRRPLKDWKADELRAEARRLGLSADGTRADLLGRIRGVK